MGDELPGVSVASCLIAGTGELDSSGFAEAAIAFGWESVGGDDGLCWLSMDPLRGSCFDTAPYARADALFASMVVGR